MASRSIRWSGCGVADEREEEHNEEHKEENDDEQKLSPDTQE